MKLNHFVIVDSSFIYGRLKRVYPSVRTVSLRSQQSTVLNAAPRADWPGGESLSFKLADGSARTGVHVDQMVAGAATARDRNVQMVVTPSQLTGYFTTNQNAQLSTKSQQGAYDSALTDEVTNLFDSMNKRFAVHFYGGRLGVLGQVRTALAVGATSFNIVEGGPADLWLQPGEEFQFADGNAGTPAPVGGIYTVVSNNAGAVTFSPALAAAVDAGDYLIAAYPGIGGAYDATGPDGLFDIIPSIRNRQGGVWTNYINQSFRNLVRANAVSKLAGKFIHADANAAGFLFMPVFQRMLSAVQNYGGLPPEGLIAISPVLLQQVVAELQRFGNYSVLASGATQGGDEVVGRRAVGAAFNEMVPLYLTRDPWCTLDKAYYIPQSGNGRLEIYDMGNSSVIGHAQGQLGKPEHGEWGQAGVPSENLQFAGNIRDFFDIVPGGFDQFGATYKVIGKLVAQPVIRALDRSGVIGFDLPGSVTAGADVW